MLMYTHKEHTQQTFMRTLQKRHAINAIVFLETDSQLRFLADGKRWEMKGHKKHTRHQKTMSKDSQQFWLQQNRKKRLK